MPYPFFTITEFRDSLACFGCTSAERFSKAEQKVDRVDPDPLALATFDLDIYTLFT